MGGLRQTATTPGAILAIALLAVALVVSVSQVVRAEDTRRTTEVTPDACPRFTFRVVVDVGHTVDVPGAMSARGIAEYAFNLRLARDINQSLLDAGFQQTVLLITATAPWRGLVERAARANTMHANLFIAIHHDFGSRQSEAKLGIRRAEKPIQ